MDKIIDNLYLGDIRAAANLFLLKSHVGTTAPALSFLLPLLGSHPCSASVSGTEPVFPLSKSRVSVSELSQLDTLPRKSNTRSLT